MSLDTYADVVSTTIMMDRPFRMLGDGLTLAESFDVQDAVCARLAPAMGGQVGWKIAWNVPHLMEAFEMPHPGMGRVFGTQLRHGEAEVRLSDYRGLLIEPEIVATLGADIGPGQAWDAATVAPHVAHFSAGFEILDRFGVPPEAKAPEILAHNVFNAGALVSVRQVEAKGFDPASVTTRVYDGEQTILEGTGKAPQNPFEAIAFLANHFTARGHTMEAGHIVLCGSHMPIYPVEAPTRLGVSMGALGEVWLNVSGSE